MNEPIPNDPESNEHPWATTQQITDMLGEIQPKHGAAYQWFSWCRKNLVPEILGPWSDWCRWDPRTDRIYPDHDCLERMSRSLDPNIALAATICLYAWDYSFQGHGPATRLLLLASRAYGSPAYCLLCTYLLKPFTV